MAVFDDAAALLDAVAGQLDDAPETRYVTAGPPALDGCDLLTVHPGTIVRGTFGGTRADNPCAPLYVTAVVTRVWCVPVGDRQGNPPKPAVADESGRVIFDGGVRLFLAVAAAARTLNRRPAVDQAEPLPVQGGIAGWTVTCRWNPSA